MQAMYFSRARVVGLGAVCFLGCAVTLAAMPDEVAQAVPVAPPVAPPVEIAGFGVPMSSDRLEDSRGGFDVVKNDMQLSGLVASNSAVNVATGSNFIADGAFTNASGLPTVIQNSGSNVLIQNATIVNVQFK